jgi:hypothetical protein
LPDRVLALAVAPDGRRRRSVAAWHADQGEAVFAVAFLGPGRLLSAGANGTIKLWALP